MWEIAKSNDLSALKLDCPKNMRSQQTEQGHCMAMSVIITVQRPLAVNLMLLCCCSLADNRILLFLCCVRQ